MTRDKLCVKVRCMKDTIGVTPTRYAWSSLETETMRQRYFDEYGEPLEPIRDDAQFPAGTYVTHSGWSDGIAWFVRDVSPIDDRVTVTMVGDDRLFSAERDELTVIEREAFCGECGQIGCGHDGLDRS